MASFIGKFNKNGTDYYFDYSTETGIPSGAMAREEFRENYARLHGRVGLAKLTERLERADSKGTSAHKRNTLDEMLKGNRAGEDAKELSTTEIIDLLMAQRERGRAAKS